MAEKKCPKCHRPYPDGHAAKVRAKRGASIRKALAETDKQIGRPRIRDYSWIYSLRDQGLSLMQIANRIGTSRGVVQHALRLRAAAHEKSDAT